MSDDLKVGDIYEDCFYHPVVCTEIDGDEISGKSMIDGSEPRSCSLKYCGVRKLSEEEAQERIRVFKAEGRPGLLRLAGWSEDEIRKFLNQWG